MSVTAMTPVNAEKPGVVSVSLLKPLHDEGDSRRIDYRVTVAGRRYDIFFRSVSLPGQPGLEAAIPPALLAAMRLRLPIHVQGAVSRTFMKGVARVIDYYSHSFDEFHRVAVTADEYYDAEPVSTGRKASLFSGGVDSFYTLFKHQQQITDLVLIKGFDLSLRDTVRLNNASEMLGAVASAMDIQAHEVETNVATIIKDYGQWVRHGHGMALAAIARLFPGTLETVWIASSLSEEQQIPWGSSPRTDPEFSDECLEIIHDADAALRSDKLAMIAKQPLALKYMRPCPDTKNNSKHNCCRCEKCIRTMVGLYALGALDKADAFPRKLTPGDVYNVLVLDEKIKIYWRENLVLLESSGEECGEYIKATRSLLDCSVKAHKRRFKWRRKRRHLAEKLNKLWRKLAGSTGG